MGGCIDLSSAANEFECTVASYKKLMNPNNLIVAATESTRFVSKCRPDGAKKSFHSRLLGALRDGERSSRCGM